MFLTGYNADYTANIDENEEISIEEFRANVEMMNRLMAENVKNMEKGKMTFIYTLLLTLFIHYITIVYTLLLKYVKRTTVSARILLLSEDFILK